MIRCERGGMSGRLFSFEGEEGVVDEDDTLDEREGGFGETDVGVASVELPALEVVVGEPGRQDVQDGSHNAEEQVLQHSLAITKCGLFSTT